MTEVTHAGLLAEEHAETRERRLRFSLALGEIAAAGGTADGVQAAVARHLAQTRAGELPLAAQTIWLERIARPLKADAAKPLPPRAIAGIRSWPSSRVGELVATLAEIEKVLVEAENDAHHEVIYAEISRAYS